MISVKNASLYLEMWSFMKPLFLFQITQIILPSVILSLTVFCPSVLICPTVLVRFLSTMGQLPLLPCLLFRFVLSQSSAFAGLHTDVSCPNSVPPNPTGVVQPDDVDLTRDASTTILFNGNNGHVALADLNPHTTDVSSNGQLRQSSRPTKPPYYLQDYHCLSYMGFNLQLFLLSIHYIVTFHMPICLPVIFLLQWPFLLNMSQVSTIGLFLSHIGGLL